jgi:hypothetical protein
VAPAQAPAPTENGRAFIWCAALLVVSLLLVAWSLVLWRDARIGSEASKRILERPSMSDSEWSRSIDQLERAELLNPGTQWEATRANALLLRDKPEARRVAESILAAEPDNLDAWIVVYQAVRGRNLRLAARAQAEIRRLNPEPTDD